ncbi:unnamed protein product, partial [Polarella glacialis]
GTELLIVAGSGDDPQLRVEDESGAHGELWITGPQVGRGYLRRPELTAARFLTLPSLGPCFRTGDIVAARARSSIGGEKRQQGWQLLGRRDGMVKLRGRRVELGEVEE